MADEMRVEWIPQWLLGTSDLTLAADSIGEGTMSLRQRNHVGTGERSGAEVSAGVPAPSLPAQHARDGSFAPPAKRTPRGAPQAGSPHTASSHAASAHTASAHTVSSPARVASPTRARQGPAESAPQPAANSASPTVRQAVRSGTTDSAPANNRTPANGTATQDTATAITATAGGEYRSVLLARKQEVMAGMGMKFDAASKLDHMAEDDAVQIAHDEFINLRLNAIGWDQLRLMDEALDRLQTGDFGICMRCEEPISPKRLAIVPWAKYCVRCQEKITARGISDASSAGHLTR